MEFTLRPSLTRKEEEFKLRRNRSMDVNEKEISRLGDRRDAKILTTMWIMIATGLSVFLSGFLIWNLDIKFCPTIRRWRRQIGLPWGILLEGHGWWYATVVHRSEINANTEKAFDDWPWCLLLHNLGHLAPPLFEWSSGRFQDGMALDLLAA